MTKDEVVELAMEIWKIEFITEEDRERLHRFAERIMSGYEAAELRGALTEVAATLAWLAHGECRSFKDGPILPSSKATELASAVLAKSKWAGSE